MALRTPLILNQTTARIEELAAADTIHGYMIEGYLGRNRVINGDFRFWQRGTGFSLAGYGADRFLNNISGITCSMTRLALGVGEAAGFKYACRMAFSGGSDPAQYATLQHRLEDLGYYSGKTLTFSGYMRANTAGLKVAFEVALGAGGGTIPGAVPVSGIGVQTFTLGTTWQRFTATFTVPNLAGASLTDNSSLNFNLWLSAGSNHNSRNNNLGFQSGIVDFVGLQLEEGSSASAFEYRPDALELALCQRYGLMLDYGKGNAFALVMVISSNTILGFLQYPVQMRTTPSATRLKDLPTYTGAGAPAGTNATSMNMIPTGTQQLAVTAVLPVTLTTNTIGYIGSTSTNGFQIFLDAEI